MHRYYFVGQRVILSRFSVSKLYGLSWLVLSTSTKPISLPFLSWSSVSAILAGFVVDVVATVISKSALPLISRTEQVLSNVLLLIPYLLIKMNGYISQLHCAGEYNYGQVFLRISLYLADSIDALHLLHQYSHCDSHSEEVAMSTISLLVDLYIFFCRVLFLIWLYRCSF